MTRTRISTRARKTGDDRRLDDATRLAKALSHPLRNKILIRLNRGVASPNELAQELGEPLGNVSYHVRALAGLGCIELVETAPRRGAVEHYYRAIERVLADDATWAQFPPTVRRGFVSQWFETTFGDLAEAINAGKFDTREDTHTSFTPLLLDEPAWEELGELLKDVLDRAIELQAEAAGRLADGDGDGDGGGQRPVPANLVMAQYEGVPAEDKAKS